VIARLFVLLTLLPALEIVLLVWVATHTSSLFVLALIVGTAVFGAWLARHQGARAARSVLSEWEQGRMPAEALLDGLLVFVAAILLIVPGFLTDIAAIGLLLPPSRRALKEWLKRRIRARLTTRQWQSVPPARDQIIDVRLVDTHQRRPPG
jgi:UPF0716 protein FxsA